MWGYSLFGKQRGGQVTVAGIGQQSNDLLACVLGALCQLQRSPDRSTGRDTHQNAFLVADQAAGGKGVVIFDGDDLVVDLGVQHVGDEACADALDLVGAGDAGGQHGGGLGLHGDYLDGGVLFLQELANAGDGAAGADTGAEAVNGAGYLFQNFELLDNLTGRENIMVPLSIHNISEAEGGKRLEQLAKYLEITEVLDKFPSQMSGGQKQRLAAARALILNPGIILADEPTGALDSRNAKALMEKLAGLNRDEKATVLMVTHDSNAASYCKRILFIQDGVIFHELRRDLLAETQQQFYERILQVMAQLGGGSANVL